MQLKIIITFATQHVGHKQEGRECVERGGRGVQLSNRLSGLWNFPISNAQPCKNKIKSAALQNGTLLRKACRRESDRGRDKINKSESHLLKLLQSGFGGTVETSHASPEGKNVHSTYGRGQPASSGTLFLQTAMQSSILCPNAKLLVVVLFDISAKHGRILDQYRLSEPQTPVWDCKGETNPDV